MATKPLEQILWHLRGVLLRHDVAGVSDGHLLECFLAHRDEAAFAALVHRHGPMVLGVCRRVLNNSHDAEDAFQVTFLVLARKAASIVPRENVSYWLYGVAYHTALKARAAAARRRVVERKLRNRQRSPSSPPEYWEDVQCLLDRELNRLPEKYRHPVVLCDLEGLTRRDAARRLGWPVGTVSGRLARARQLLARRLARHGLTLSAGALATMVSQNASACVPAVLTATAVRNGLLVATDRAAGPLLAANVSSLLEGVLKTMVLAKLKIATAIVLAISAAGVAVGLLTCSAAADAGKKTGDRTATQELAVPRQLPATPSMHDLVACLNDNARKVQTLQCADVSIEFRKGFQTVSMPGKLAYQRPGHFRFIAEPLGSREMDIGSNDKEYWFWMKRSDPFLSFHGLYQTSGCAKTFPIVPEYLMEVLGLVEHSVPSTYEISVRHRTIDFSQQATYLGRAARKVIVFNRFPNPIQVADYMLHDANGKTLYAATIKEVQQDPSGAVLPCRLEIVYPEQRISFKVKLGEIAVNARVNHEWAASVFARPAY